MKYYHVNETDEIISTDTLRSDYYETFADDYQTFDDYVKACMWYNNGELTPVEDKLTAVKRELNRKLAFADTYGYDEYADELTELLAELHRYSKYVRGGR